MSSDPARRACAALLLAMPAVTLADADDAPAEPRNAATSYELPELRVIGVTPLPGLGQPLRNVPSNVQTGSAKQLREQGTADLVDFMNNSLNGVNVNENQANPFQVDVNFRGFAASPRLGTPQGLSVYVDGVRVNEAFGDVVNWDFIPDNAISTISLMPGSNPSFGLNTLGGALSVQTKSGKQFPGTVVEGFGGSFGRRAGSIETGVALDGGFDLYLTGNYYDEDGWRDSSPSHLRQTFGKLGWENDRTDFDLSFAMADNNLIGNSYAPETLLAARRSAVYTTPDQTVNHFQTVNLTGSHFLAEHWLVNGNVYYRHVISRLSSGDLNDDYDEDYEDAFAPGGVCDGAADADACARANLADSTGLVNRSRAKQRRWGATLQLTANAPLAGLDNSATLGAAWDDGRSGFQQEQAAGALNPDRSTALAGPFDLQNRLRGDNRSYGVYFTDTLSPTPWLHVTASARYNGVVVELKDLFGNTLNGRNAFYRVNPALGFTLTPTDTLTLYANYNEGSRSPTPIELGCADPAVPCQLPNALASDPPLKPVVARTVEAGGRGELIGKALSWSLGVYQTRTADDIQFISSTVSGAGYFANVGTVRRRGGEAGLGGQLGRFRWRASYSFVDATYRTPFQLVAADNSSADANGVIDVQAGNRLPLVPRHTGRLLLDYGLGRHFTVGSSLIYSSGQYLAGNNNNRHRAGDNGTGTLFAGSGRVGAYALLNLHATLTVVPGLTLFSRVNNVLDRGYSTAGTLAINAFNPDGSFRSNPDDWTHENAVSPGAPRNFTLGVRAEFGGD